MPSESTGQRQLWEQMAVPRDPGEPTPLDAVAYPPDAG
jgi:hypothetical protein